ncbi:hypothetical protein ACWEFL_11800 [Streptomyces sp. NPDC004838]
MSGQTRKQQDVRRMLAAGRPPAPADLAARAVERGTRLLRRRRRARLAAWALLLALVIALTVWLAVREPWAAEPSTTTPPVEGY